MRLKPSTELKRPLPDEQDKEVDRFLADERAKMDFHEDRWLYWIRVILLFFVLLMTLAVLFTFVFHIIMPQEWRWLSIDESKYIRDLAVTIIAGLIMSIVTAYYFKKR